MGPPAARQAEVAAPVGLDGQVTAEAALAVEIDEAAATGPVGCVRADGRNGSLVVGDARSARLPRSSSFGPWRATGRAAYCSAAVAAVRNADPHHGCDDIQKRSSPSPSPSASCGGRCIVGDPAGVDV